MAALYKVDGSFDKGLLAGASCAFGVFDGVHRGHRYIIGEAARSAQEGAGPCVVLTFDVDPDEVFRPDALKKLMSNERRLAAIASLEGVDAVVVFPFTRAFAALEPVEFLEEVFGGHVPASIHVGRDFRFGAKAAGGIEQLEAWARPHGMRVFGHGLLQAEGAPVTSTRIRGLLGQGRIEQANELLGAAYAVEGAVEPGRAAGRDMGFRTANLKIAPSIRALGEGVYAAWATVGEKRFKAAVSVGVSPTFDEATANVEVHILDFDGNLYDRVLVVEFVSFLRPMIKFESAEELIATVMGNIQWVRENL